MKKFKKASDIKVGVIGYGGAFNMGNCHLSLMQKAGMTPCAVTEIDPARLAAATKDFPGIGTYSTVEKMLAESDVNLVTLITPHNTHAPLALECLRAGRHVVCEKPLAITTAECDAMISMAKKKGVMLSTFHNRHWDGCILEALKRIRKEKCIGDVFRIEAHMGGYGKPGDWWRGSKSISGGILYDWGVHLLEYSLQLINSEIVEVTGFAHNGFWAPNTRWKKDTHEDEAAAHVRFKSGAWVSLCITNLDSKPKQGWLEITGTKGTYIMNGGDYEIINIRDGQTVTTKGKNQNGNYEAYYSNIAAHLVKGEKLVISGEWARRPIHVIDLACRSAEKGMTLRAKYK